MGCVSTTDKYYYNMIRGLWSTATSTHGLSWLVRSTNAKVSEFYHSAISTATSNPDSIALFFIITIDQAGYTSLSSILTSSYTSGAAVTFKSTSIIGTNVVELSNVTRDGQKLTLTFTGTALWGRYIVFSPYNGVFT